MRKRPKYAHTPVFCRRVRVNQRYGKFPLATRTLRCPTFDRGTLRGDGVSRALGVVLGPDRPNRDCVDFGQNPTAAGRR